MRTPIMDIHLLSEKVHHAFHRAKLDPHVEKGALVTAVSCFAARPPYFHKEMLLDMVALPPEAPDTYNGTRYFNQLSGSGYIYDMSPETPQLRPCHDAAAGRVINCAGPHLVMFMLNDKFRADTERVLDLIERDGEPEPNLVQKALHNRFRKPLKYDIIGK